MDPWKRLRLLICIVLMLGMIVFGAATRLLLGVPDAPYGYIDPWSALPRRIDPFQTLHIAYEPVEREGTVISGCDFLVPTIGCGSPWLQSGDGRYAPAPT